MSEPEVLIDVKPFRPVEKSRWGFIRRVVKYANQCVLLVAMLITAVSCFQSYRTMNDWLSPRLFASEQCFFVCADRGTIYSGFFDNPSGGYWIAEHSPYSPIFRIEEGTGTAGANESQQAPFKFGSISKIRRAENLEPYKREGYLDVYVTCLTRHTGHGLYFPHCIAVIVLGTMLALVTFGRRFTLRGLMIWITVVCLLMGIQIAAASYQPPQHSEDVK